MIFHWAPRPNGAKSMAKPIELSHENPPFLTRNVAQVAHLKHQHGHETSNACLGGSSRGGIVKA